MKAVAKTGLVPVLMGDRIFGVPPIDAVKGLERGDFVLVDIPDDIETIDVAGHQPVVKEVDDIIDPLKGLVEIPNDWREAHGAKRAVLAKAIKGVGPKEQLKVPDGVSFADYAIKVIEDELARREDLKSQQSPNPETTA